MLNNEIIWSQKYRPRTVEETILPNDIKNIFKQYVKDGEIPNLIFTGGPGVGKTTAAKAMLDELDYNYIVINGSLDGNIDTLRNEIMSYASSVSLNGKRKYVILDECDFLNPSSTQPALRNFMEEYSQSCGFILTCNYPNKILKEIRSRNAMIEFKVSQEDKLHIATQYLKKSCSILEEENIKYDKNAVAAVITKFFPDFRKILNELQLYSVCGSIDSGILVNLTEVSFNNLIRKLKEKDFTEVRKWVSEATNLDTLFRTFYDTASKYVAPSSVPILVLLIAKYQYQASFSADLEVNIAAFLVEVMLEMKWL